MKKSLIILILPLLLINCSAITGEEIAFWSDMDMVYKGSAELRFKMKIFKGDKKISELEIDPTKKNITIGEIKSSINNKTKWSFTGKNSEFKIKEDGTYRISVIFIASDNPSLKINKAELIIKK